jgi:replicative DNA helicase
MGDTTREEARRQAVSLNGAGAHDETPPDENVTRVDLLIEMASHRLVPGGGFVLDAPETVESIWGDGHQCLWAKGEPFLIVGPDGVGKTSIAQQLALALGGIRSSVLLGLSTVSDRRVLYLACDRPAQAARSLRRMVTEADRALLEERLVVWRGPLPFDLAEHPEALLTLTKRAACDAVVVDSLKDVASGLTKDEVGQGINNSFQIVCAEGIEVVALHHQRKAQAGAGKPKAISDVYGSRWLTSGMGSVVMLWGEAGDLVVELGHLKQPDETLGPFNVLHDHVAGTTTVVDHVDAYTVVAKSRTGATAAMAAEAMFGNTERNSVEKARRQLERLTSEGKVHRVDGVRGGTPPQPTRYVLVSHLHLFDGGSDA